ncbi:A disintegrin and metalloproteinase with thrombospondin motifs 9-like isoform X2 [Tachypleus tridentatus]|uniref:A disintegrin and metalloproteinase with thrombospondin motifs 9-like isoform X2 n=1 Tax=Tachypleus tridentatus TaxID=6853 RepID=UPI003FD3A407
MFALKTFHVINNYLDPPRSVLSRSQVVYPVRVEKHDKRWGRDREQEKHYKWEAFNKTFNLNLHQENSFISPHFSMQTVDSFAENTTVWMHSSIERSCYYQGRIQGDKSSRVFVSLCQGMLGLLHTSDGDYSIEPVTYVLEFKNLKNVPHRMTPLISAQSSEENRRSPIERCHLKDSTSPKNKLKRNDKNEYVASAGNHRLQFRNTTNTRFKRSVSVERYVEVLVAVDKLMANLYRDNLRNYVLTLMSSVSMIYKEPSLGNVVNIVVVKLVTLSDEENKEIIHSSASKTLRSFCRWQRINNHEDDSHPHHHDTAVLLTREDLCRVTNSCDTLGLANPGMACSRYSSCAIVEDNGLSAAFTIAHELGHVLGIPHDDDLKCSKYRERGQPLNIMARMLDDHSYPWNWSSCSKKYISNFLDTTNGECLNDKPTENLLKSVGFGGKHPGELYDMDEQCQLVFGTKSKICPYMPVCGKLWCTLEGNNYGCRTQHMPWSEGTFCGPNKWCKRGECVQVDKRRQEAIHGQWGKWQSYGHCSRKCGGGIQRSVRECDNPRPTNGGRYCLGQRTRYLSCNTHECPLGTPEARVEQCATFNGKTMNFVGLPSNVKWTPYYPETRSEACKLYCQATGSSPHFLLQDRVIDGTPCELDTFDVCVNGVCQNAGCDRVLGSNKTLDRCGICGGDNTTCRTVYGHYNEFKYGYNSVVMIPAGASNIEILQRGYQNSHQDDNYLALMASNQEYILNGNFTVSPFKKIIKFYGTILEYSGSVAVIERINSSKPLKKELYVQVLTVGDVRPPNIQFEYTVSIREENKYTWELERKWSDCSRVCGGEMLRSPICIRIFDNLKVNNNHCDVTKKPSALVKTCNDHCKLRWRVTASTTCSVRCGWGTQQRIVKCVQEFMYGKMQEVSEEFCEHLANKPSDTEQCEGNCPKAEWMFQKWSSCSKTCGGGEQIRSAICVGSDGKKLDERHCETPEKITRKECNTDPCPEWKAGNWTKCSVTCGIGEKYLTYWCHYDGKSVSETYCDPKRVPIRKELCKQTRCPKWEHGSWGACNKPCGGGFQNRLIACRDGRGNSVPEHKCDVYTRPRETQGCNTEDCPSYLNYRWFLGTWSSCSVTCGQGIRRRHIRCLDGLDRSVSIENCHGQSPERITKCFQSICAEWKFSDWTECSTTCGRGKQIRHVRCLQDNVTVNDSVCERIAPKSEIRSCFNKPCVFRWKKGPWSKCSVTCGRGQRQRKVSCLDSRGFVVVDKLCESKRKPKTVRRCKRVPLCPFSWIPDEWTQCSTSCGPGIQTRQVYCHRVNAYGWIEPEHLIEVHNENTHWCDLSKKPNTLRICNVGSCHKRAVWKPWRWNPCPVSCGMGKQRRRVSCHNIEGKQISKKNCDRSLRPKRKRACIVRPCAALSCRDIQEQKRVREDGEQYIYVRGKLMKMYCARMNTSNPQEYISLPSGESNNYSEVYDKRLLRPDTCPYNGTRYDFCPCVKERRIGSGLTTFSKVAINITTLQVLPDDFTFSETLRGHRVRFGEAGDCYSFKECPQGRFSINLKDTGLVVSEVVQWKMYGTRPVARIQRLEKGQTIQGKCGGYCGKCSPDMTSGLLLDITPP